MSSSGPIDIVSICVCAPTTCSSAERNSTASLPWVTRTSPIITEAPAQPLLFSRAVAENWHPVASGPHILTNRFRNARKNEKTFTLSALGSAASPPCQRRAHSRGAFGRRDRQAEERQVDALEGDGFCLG